MTRRPPRVPWTSRAGTRALSSHLKITAGPSSDAPASNFRRGAAPGPWRPCLPPVSFGISRLLGRVLVVLSSPRTSGATSTVGTTRRRRAEGKQAMTLHISLMVVQGLCRCFVTSSGKLRVACVGCDGGERRLWLWSAPGGTPPFE